MKSKNAIEYWYPKIEGLVPTPRTVIIPIEWKWDESGETVFVEDKYIEKIREQAERFIYPIFIRGSDSSIKHSWENTCFVKTEKDLRKHINTIIYETLCLDVFSSIPCTSIAVREYIEMDSSFTFFRHGLPINPEQRYFIYNHKIICSHPYWTEESIPDERYKPVLGKMNNINKEEKKLINKYACTIAEEFDGYWSIDFCRARNGKWYCIDMANGHQSWHPKCNFKIFNKPVFPQAKNKKEQNENL